MKIGIVLGTRPEIIKMAPVMRACQDRGVDFDVIHTNQHYSDNMDKIFFEELELPQPAFNLNIGSGMHGEMTGRMMIELEKIFTKQGYSAVLVEGDTNTVMAGALVASKLSIKVGHIEAGLRSYDRSMPEELNRVVTDHVSDYLFPPTERQAGILRGEGIPESKLYTVGNTIVDAVYQGIEIAERKSNILSHHDLIRDNYILLTSHRPATVDSKDRLGVVMQAVQDIASKYNKKVIFPAHPRTQKMLQEFNISLGDHISVVDPVGYLDMLVLQKASYLIVTDSGGIQEEACILQKKAVVIRENTERPEAVDVGGCVLAGNSDKSAIIASTEKLISVKVDWYNPFGDGNAGQNILKIVSEGNHPFQIVDIDNPVS